MATLDAFEKNPLTALLTGVAVKCYPADLAFDVVIQRAPDVSGSPGSWGTITRLRSTKITGGVYVDELPVDGTSYWYRAYHARLGWDDGPVTRAVQAQAGVLSKARLADLASLEYVSGIDAGTVARQGHGVYFETFEVDPKWEVFEGTPTITLEESGAQAGGRVLRVNDFGRMASRALIPFDSSKLYRMRARVRLQTAPTNGDTDHIYIGVAGVAADGVTLVNRAGANLASSQHYVCVSDANLSALDSLGTWIEFTGWFKGWAATGSTPHSTDPRTPSQLHQNVRYLRPLVVPNYNLGNGITELDELAIDVFDEEGQNRLYEAILSVTTLSETMRQTDGIGPLSIIKGRQRFSGIKHGDVLAFDPVFQNIPQGRYLGGGISVQPLNAWGVNGTNRLMRGNMALNDSTVVATYGTFTANDVGKSIRIEGAGFGGAAYSASVASFTDSTHVEVTGGAPGAFVGVTDAVIIVGDNDDLPPVTAPQYPEVRFDGLSASGCTVNARLRQKKTTLTQRDNNFPGTSLDAVADPAIAVTLANAPAIDNRYTVRFDVDMSAEMPLNKSPDWCSIQIDGVIEVVVDGGAPETVATFSYIAEAQGYGDSQVINVTDSRTFVFAGLDATDTVQMRITSITEAGNPSRIVSGSITPVDVRYQTGSSSDQFASMTPGPDDGIDLEFEDAG